LPITCNFLKVAKCAVQKGLPKKEQFPEKLFKELFQNYFLKVLLSSTIGGAYIANEINLWGGKMKGLVFEWLAFIPEKWRNAYD